MFNAAIFFLQFKLSAVCRRHHSPLMSLARNVKGASLIKTVGITHMLAEAQH